MIVVRFMGGFANQLFQYAMYLKLKEAFPDVKIYADITPFKYKSLHGGFKLDRFVEFEYYTKSLSELIHVTEDNYDSIFTDISCEKDYFFDGYWQDAAYFPKDKTRLNKIFDAGKFASQSQSVTSRADEGTNKEIHEEVSEKAYTNYEYLQLIENTLSVSLHVRRGDYIHDHILGNVATKCFYDNALKYVKQHFDNPHIFVFSDDIKWCRSGLDYQGMQVTFVTGNNDCVQDDITLMSHCKHNIISNSSFSWWASYLNNNPDKVIITPEYWFSQPTTVKEIVVPGAVRLPNTPVFENAFEAPDYTFIIVTFEGLCTFKRLMSTILNQTHSSIQVIIVSTCSELNNDIKSYMERDSRIVLIDKSDGDSCVDISNTSDTSDISGISKMMPLLYEGIKKASGKKILFPLASDYYNLDACKHISEEYDNANVLDFGIMIKPGNAVPDSLTKEKLYNKKMMPLFYRAYSLDIIKNAIEANNVFSGEIFAGGEMQPEILLDEVLYYHMDSDYADKTRPKRNIFQKVIGKIKRIFTRQ